METGRFIFSCGFRKVLKADLSFLVPDSSVEVFALDAQEVVSRVDDATFSGDGSGCVNVVTRHHPHRDAGALTLTDGLGHLGGRGDESSETRTRDAQQIHGGLPRVGPGPLSRPQ